MDLSKVSLCNIPGSSCDAVATLPSLCLFPPATPQPLTPGRPLADQLQISAWLHCPLLYLAIRETPPSKVWAKGRCHKGLALGAASHPSGESRPLSSHMLSLVSRIVPLAFLLLLRPVVETKDIARPP